MPKYSINVETAQSLLGDAITRNGGEKSSGVKNDGELLWSSAAIADEIGINIKTYERLMKGEEMQESVVLKFADFLGIDLHTLIALDDQRGAYITKLSSNVATSAKARPEAYPKKQAPTKMLMLEIEGGSISSFPTDKEIVRKALEFFDQLSEEVKVRQVSLATMQVKAEGIRSASSANEYKSLLEDILQNPARELPKYLPVQVLTAIAIAFEMQPSELVTKGSKEAEILQQIEAKHQRPQSALSSIKSRFLHFFHKS